ncbi:MAG: hypothetical protein ABIK89_01080 [Planctomycetota bacterium]
MNRPRLWLTLLLLSGASATPAADVPGPWVEIPADFGWDADNNAATAGTIIGVIRGRAWMRAQGWQIADRYRNTTRAPANVEPLADAAEQFASRRAKLKPEIEAAVTGHTAVPERARAVYLAICFDLAEPLRRQAPEQWARAVAALNEFPDLLRLVAESPTPAAAALHKQAAAVGVEAPGNEGAGDKGEGERGEGREVRGER